jgi:hypothetical protein
VAVAFGRAGLAIVFVSFFAATFAAAAESALSSGYSVAQYMGFIRRSRSNVISRSSRPSSCSG